MFDMKYAVALLLLVLAGSVVFAQDCADEDYKCQVELYREATDSDEIFRLAYAYGELKKYDSAVREYSRYIELRPDNPAGYYNRGHDLYNQKEFKRALADFDRAVELDPSDLDSIISRGDTRGELGDHSGSIEDYNAALALKDDRAEIYYNRGLEYEAIGETARELGFAG